MPKKKGKGNQGGEVVLKEITVLKSVKMEKQFVNNVRVPPCL